MEIKRKELLQALNRCMPGIETGNAVLVGSDTFVFNDGYVSSYNDIISVRVPLESIGAQELHGAVKAEEFFRVLSKLNAEVLTIEPKEKGWQIKCGKSRLNMSLIDFDYNDRFNKLTATEDNDWSEIDNSVIEGINRCLIANNKSQVSGVFMQDNSIVSTDGNQAHKVESPFTLPRCWLSDKVANELVKVTDVNKMRVASSWVHFGTENGATISVKTLQAENYPIENIEKLLERFTQVQEDEVSGTFPKELFPAIDRAVSFSLDIDDKKSVKLTLSEKGIEVYSQKTSGNYTERVQWTDDVQGKLSQLIIYVDVDMMTQLAKKSLDFYLRKGPKMGDKQTYRMVFVAEDSVHIMATLDYEG